MIAAFSIVLPIAGGLFALAGLLMLMQGNGDGGWWLAGGAALVVFDYLTDIWLYRVSDDSDEPTLNQRGHKLIGRTAVLNQPIVAGRGRLRLGDSWWRVEGPDLAAGTKVRVVDVRASVLVVEAA